MAGREGGLSAAKRRGLAVAAAVGFYGASVSSRKKIRVTTLSSTASCSTDSAYYKVAEAVSCRVGGGAASAMAMVEEDTTGRDGGGERLEDDGDDVVGEEFVEEEDNLSGSEQPESDEGEDAGGELFVDEEEGESQSAGEGEHPESDGADVDGEEEFTEMEEMEEEDEREDEISGSDSAGDAAAEEVEGSQGDREDYEESGGGDQESMEEDDWEGSFDASEEEGSPRPISPAPSPPSACSEGTAVEVEDVVVAHADALDCGVCFLPLKHPIFQCERGHVVCSPCCDKLKAAASSKCHVCGVATGQGYSRCHAMEYLVSSIRVRCPHVANGCKARPAYHDRDAHSRVCPHTPCLCPGGASCGFAGSTTALLDHFATVHGWPCTMKVRASENFSIRLHDGFNFLGVDRVARDDDHLIGDTPPPWLFLLNVTQESFGRAISVFCIQPLANNRGDDDLPAPIMTSRCELMFSHYDDHSSSDGEPCLRYHQTSRFQVTCTDLSNGLLSPDLCFLFVVPNSVLLGDDDRDGIQVNARIVIN